MKKNNRHFFLSVLTLALLTGGVATSLVACGGDDLTIDTYYAVTYTADSHSRIVSVDTTALPETILEGETLSFKVEVDSGYAILTVKNGNSKLTADAGGVYKVEHVASDVAINVVTSQLEIASLSYTGELANPVQYDGATLDVSGLTFVGTYSDSTIVEISVDQLNLPTIYVGSDVYVTLVSDDDISVKIEGLTVEYTISYDLGSTLSWAEGYTAKTSYLNEAFTLPTVDDLSVIYGKGEKAFEGWYFDSSYTEEATIDESTTGNRTLYAKVAHFSSLTPTIIAVEGSAELQVSGVVEAAAASENVKLVVSSDDGYEKDVVATIDPETYAFTASYDLAELQVEGKRYNLQLYYSDSEYIDLSKDDANMGTSIVVEKTVDGQDYNYTYSFKEYDGSLKVVFDISSVINPWDYITIMTSLVDDESGIKLIATGSITEEGLQYGYKDYLQLSIYGYDDATKESETFAVDPLYDGNDFTFTFDLTLLQYKGVWYDLTLRVADKEYLTLSPSQASDYNEILYTAGNTYKYESWDNILKINVLDHVDAIYNITSTSFVSDETGYYLTSTGTFSGCTVDDIYIKFNDDGTPIHPTDNGDGSFAFTVDLSTLATGDNYVKIAAQSTEPTKDDYGEFPFDSFVGATRAIALDNSAVVYLKRWDNFGSGLIIVKDDSVVSSAYVSLIADEEGKPTLISSDLSYTFDVQYSVDWATITSSDGKIDLSSVSGLTSGTTFYLHDSAGANLATKNFDKLASVTYAGLTYSTLISRQDVQIAVTNA
jgi:hypothetical protein